MHCDPHYTSVLAADREPWPAIDPSLAAGPRVRDRAPLWNRLQEVTAAARPVEAVAGGWRLACEHAGIDPGARAGPAVVREAQNAEWAAESADDVELARHLTPADLLTRDRTPKTAHLVHKAHGDVRPGEHLRHKVHGSASGGSGPRTS